MTCSGHSVSGAELECDSEPLCYVKDPAQCLTKIKSSKIVSFPKTLGLRIPVLGDHRGRHLSYAPGSMGAWLCLFISLCCSKSEPVHLQSERA